MQRCPYIHEMKERLLSQSGNAAEILLMDAASKQQQPHQRDSSRQRELHSRRESHGPYHNHPQSQSQLLHESTGIETVVKLNSDGFGSHTLPILECQRQRHNFKYFPKNAKTSQFIFLSFIYAKLLIVMCIAYVLSEVITHKLPVECYEDNNCTSSTYSFMESKETVYKRRIEFNFYINNFLEGFFTYLYGVSIFFLLYVFCFLLQESSCCQGNSEPKPVKQKKVKEKKVKEKEKAEKKAKEKEEKAKEKEREKEKKKEEKEKKKDKKKEKDPKDGGGAGDTQPPPAGKEKTPAEIPQPNKKQSNLFQGVVTTAMKKEKGLETPSQDSIHEYEPSPPVVVNFGRKRKTSQNNQSHGSFFLRVGAIAFGLGTMIYNGLEFGVFFETPFHSPCYQILKGINPVLQMIFTFMQMYFIFMNSRLNIHRFKVVARFGLMHIVATNLCVWIRTLVLESIKEYDLYMSKHNKTMLPTVHPTTVVKNLTSEFALFGNASSTPKFWDTPVAEALVMLNGTYIDPTKCGRVNIMGNIVRDSAPYLYPFIVEYSLIGAAVIYIMWKHIGRWPKYTEEDLEQRLEAMLSRRAIAMAQATTGRMDCVGASKGLFFGLLLLVGSLICLILFFVLIHHPQLGLLAIYLADVSHCAIMGLSILAILIGFWRVRRLKYYYDEGNSLNDLLQRVSAFGIFVYAMFSVIAGSLTAMTSEPNLLVMITGSLTVLQVLCQVVFISDISRRRVYLPEHDCSKPGRQIVTFLLICNITMWIIYTFDAQKVTANPVQLNFYGFLAWSMIQRITLPLSIFYRFHAAVTLAEVWKTSYKPRID